MQVQRCIDNIRVAGKRFRNIYIWLYFSELDQIFLLFHLYSSVAQTSTRLCSKIHLIWFKSESIISHEKREWSKSNVTNISIWSMVTISAQTHCKSSKNPTKQDTSSKIFPFSLLFLGLKTTTNKVVNGVQHTWRGWWPYFILKHLWQLVLTSPLWLTDYWLSFRPDERSGYRTV